MPDPALVQLMSELARLTSARSSKSYGESLGLAHRKLREFAEDHGHDEDWCDSVLLTFLQRDRLAA